MPDTTPTPIAISDVGTKLLKLDTVTSKYIPFINVTSAPATGSAPSPIKVTELDSPYEQYINDRPDTPAYEFEFNYTKEKYATVLAGISNTEPKKYLIAYQDGSGETFTGLGSAWKKEVTGGSAIKGGLSFAVSAHAHVPDTAALITV